MSFKTGQATWIDCDVMFPNEKSIRFVLSDPEEKIIFGFVPQEFIKIAEGTRSGMVSVVVTATPHKGKVPIILPGELLTSTNPVLVSTSWLTQHSRKIRRHT